ncbi:hypothetical protein OESDEN_04030 [Oesophagostomum dentatum]|uniref:Uncharacterized protein n=1 Tax=Oesophagostomum dentatum TaxID=61180 RepID=A0A0B1TFH8_OESDE|nr:hypothetical protein OESDEN_04030 [Oesophagostomum dentatum]
MENGVVEHAEKGNGHDPSFEQNGVTKLKIGTGKREDYLSWEDYFMAIAKLAAMRSKDPATQSRLSEVVYLRERPKGNWSYDATRKMFDLAGIKYREFKTNLDSVVITFD